MKRIKSLLLVFFIGLLMPCFVKADCGPAGYDDFYAIVSNQNGAVTYEEKERDIFKKTDYVIPYGEKVQFMWDAAKADDYYIILITYKNHSYFVKSVDFTNEDIFNVNNNELVKTNYYTVFDTEVRSGPSFSHKVIGTIKKDTNLKGIVDKELNQLRGVGSWVYVSDGNISGYVYYEKCMPIMQLTIGQIVDEELYYLSNEENELNLKFGDILNAKYVINYAKHKVYYVENNGNYVTFENHLIGIKSNTKLMILEYDDITIWLTDVNTLKKVKIANYLEVGKVYDVIYEQSDIYNVTYYIEVNNKLYALNYCDGQCEESDYDFKYQISVINFSKEETITLTSDVLYAKNLYDEDSLKTISKGETISLYKIIGYAYDDETIYYSKKYDGFIKIKNKIEDTNDEINDPVTDDNKENNKEVEDDEVIVADGLTSRDYVIIGLFVAVIVSIIAIVCLVSFNKKRV